jgi:hypothetical protein
MLQYKRAKYDFKFSSICQISSKTSNFRIKVDKVGNVQIVYWHRFLLKYMKTERFIKNGQIQRHGQHWGTKVTTLGREDTGRRLLHSYDHYIVRVFFNIDDDYHTKFKVVSYRKQELHLKHRPVTNYWQTLSHNVVHLALIENRT